MLCLPYAGFFIHGVGNANEHTCVLEVLILINCIHFHPFQTAVYFADMENVKIITQATF